MQSEVVVIDTDKGIVKKIRVDAWISRHGRKYPDERTARYDSATHTHCQDCTAVIGKHTTICESCMSKRAFAKWDKTEKKPWDGESPIYSDSYDKYFFDGQDGLRDFMESNEIESVEDLRLYHCGPVYASTLDGDYWQDDLPEDGELPDEIYAAMKVLNDTLEAYGKPLAWIPSKYGAELSKDQLT